MNIKQAYFELTKTIMENHNVQAEKAFNKMCAVLNVTSEKDKDLLFDCLYNRACSENTAEIIQKYTENV